MNESWMDGALGGGELILDTLDKFEALSAQCYMF